MSNYNNVDNSYENYKLWKELKAKSTLDHINDLTDLDDKDVEVDTDTAYCDVCDRKLQPWGKMLVCSHCQTINNPKYELIKHKAASEGPVDDEDYLSTNPIVLNEEYSFNLREGKEEKDIFIDSLKVKGYKIIYSSKK